MEPSTILSMFDVDTENCTQRSPAWFQARCGSLGASSLAEALAKTKSGWGAGRANVMARLIAERLTGVPQETFTSAAMQHGIDTEAEARAAYEFYRDADVTEVGIVIHPDIIGTHASPDGLAGESGLVEIKCPNTATHLDYLLTGSIPDKYVVQMTWQMACTGRQWCDFASYDPRFPEEMRLFVKRIDRDAQRILELEGHVRAFLRELDDKLGQLQAKFGASQETDNTPASSAAPPAENEAEKYESPAVSSPPMINGKLRYVTHAVAALGSAPNLEVLSSVWGRLEDGLKTNDDVVKARRNGEMRITQGE